MPKSYSKCELIKIHDETWQTRRFWFRVKDTDNFEFTAGQFVTFDLPVGDKPKDRLRSYSIASAPDGTNVFELVIVLVPDGRGTPYLFQLTPGAQLDFLGPLGKMHLPSPLDKDLCFICTGTGIAPFRAMLWDIYNHNIPHQKIYLIFGSRLTKDLLYYEEMKDLASKIEGMEAIFTLSREQDPNWPGRIGYVHGIYEELFADQRPTYFFLCGWRNMIDEARDRLANMGYDKKDIHMEIYG